MKTIITSFLLALLAIYFQAPISLAYVIFGFSVIISAICLYPMSMVPSTLQEIDSAFAERFHCHWTADTLLKQITLDIYVVFTLQLLNIVFLNNYAIVFFLAIGLLLSVRKLIVYLRSNYQQDFETLLEYLGKDDEH